MHKKTPQTFFIRTYGCGMNELDSEIMAGILEKKGLLQVQEEQQADLLLFNTCSIRDLAERKVMGKIGQLGRQEKGQIIGVTGCMAMAKKETLFRKLPHIDFILGTNNISELASILDEVVDTGEKRIKTDDQFEENLDYFSAKRADPIKANVSIIRGCDKFCTYCVVPYTRGKEVSRPPDEIEKECRALIDQGYKEITLLGQNVNSYGKDQPQWSTLFHDLLYQLDKIEGLNRVRFMTSHPVDITVHLMEAVRDLPSLCELVHFPMQAGSSRILKKMHRIYTKEEYLEKVRRLQEIVPNVSLGTDMIVGFPTETEEEFLETYEAFEKIGYDVAFLYAYSPRKGTPAMRWKDDIPEKIKQERLKKLLDLYRRLHAKKLRSFVGKEVKVLVEKKNKEGWLKGRTRCWKKVIFPGEDDFIGEEKTIAIHSYNHQTLIGNCVSSPSPIGCKTGKKGHPSIDK